MFKGRFHKEIGKYGTSHMDSSATFPGQVALLPELPAVLSL